MKEIELRKHAKCSICKNLIGHTGLPIFWTIKIEHFGIDMKAVKRQDGLAALLENPYLAHVMGPNEEMTQSLIEPVELTICEKCALEQHMIAELAERGEKHE